MIDYLRGEIKENTPTFLILDVNGIGYYINISLYTHSLLKNKTITQIYIHEVIREDAYILYGFADSKEREIFRLLITVNGVGANTARVILSSLTYNEAMIAIANGDTKTFKTIKGIGTKTAERIIVDLKDKIKTNELANDDQGNFTKKTHNLHNRIASDSLSALLALGYKRKEAEKAINKVLASGEYSDVADVVRKTLKILAG